MTRWAMVFGVFALVACGGGSGSSEPPSDTAQDIATDTAMDGGTDTPKACNVEPNIASLEDNYFEMSCTFSSCHSDSAAQGGLVLTPGNAYENLVNVAASHVGSAGTFRVVPGDPEASYLVHRVENTGLDGPMPPGIVEPLGPDCQIKALRDWIAAGAPQK